MGKTGNAEFTKSMKKTHKIFLPDMLHYHNELLQAAFGACGYQLEIIPEKKNSSEYALPYISGDYCLPAMLILGQMLAFIESGECDLEHTAFMEPQTGGACRAGNYYNSMIESLKKAGYPDIPVISLNAFGDEKHEGFVITSKLIICAAAAVCYGDLLMTLSLQVTPYEKNSGDTKACWEKWVHILAGEIRQGKNIFRKKRRKRYQEIVQDFASIPIEKRKIRKVGITGEIYIKFSPIGNDHLEDFLKDAGFDYCMGGFLNYVIYIVDSELKKQCLLGAGKGIRKVYAAVISYLKNVQRDINEVVEKNGFFHANANFTDLKEMAKEIICDECNIGDGWLIAGEVAELIKQGYKNILIVHPFGCLVSHVCVRGILKRIHQKYPNINIQSIEYDYNSSKTLRESRIMLGLSGLHK